jgi:hypothetical protein
LRFGVLCVLSVPRSVCKPPLSLSTRTNHHHLHQNQEKKKKWEPPAPPPRVGKKQKKRDAAASLGTKLPAVTPSARCKLRLLKLERVKDYLLMEAEFVGNQERLKPQDERNEEDRTKVDDLRGSPLSVGSLEEIIDEKCARSGRGGGGGLKFVA